jgi:endonuclease YncB( thermonuclease family)
MRIGCWIAALGLVLVEAAAAHPGTLNREGCHHHRKSGTYHCHGDAPQAEWNGRVTVVDGDSLRMRGQDIRLHGIDAVEGDQTCRRTNGRFWACGRGAKRALAGFIGSQAVTCRERGRDQYDRVLATCGTPAGEVNDWLVRQGWAVAYRRYSREYIAAEEEARAARRNIWDGSFTNPEDYRHRKR